MFTTATSMFYATNTFFACLMLYIIYYYYLDKGLKDDDVEGSLLFESKRKSTSGSIANVHMSKYLRDHESSILSNGKADGFDTLSNIAQPHGRMTDMEKTHVVDVASGDLDRKVISAEINDAKHLSATHDQ